MFPPAVTDKIPKSVPDQRCPRNQRTQVIPRAKRRLKQDSLLDLEGIHAINACEEEQAAAGSGGQKRLFDQIAAIIDCQQRSETQVVSLEEEPDGQTDPHAD